MVRNRYEIHHLKLQVILFLRHLQVQLLSLLLSLCHIQVTRHYRIQQNQQLQSADSRRHRIRRYQQFQSVASLRHRIRLYQQFQSAVSRRHHTVLPNHLRILHQILRVSLRHLHLLILHLQRQVFLPILHPRSQFCQQRQLLLHRPCQCLYLH